jgi:hypothetical protein
MDGLTPWHKLASCREGHHAAVIQPPDPQRCQRLPVHSQDTPGWPVHVNAILSVPFLDACVECTIVYSGVAITSSMHHSRAPCVRMVET